MSPLMQHGDRAEAARLRDEERGYKISYQRLALAYIIEGFVVLASLIGAALFALQYGHNDWRTMGMMMLAPVGYAVVEFSRVPLGLSIRTQRNWGMKIFAFVGVVCAAGVTVKSMSQLGEIMFRPRLIDVVHANEAMKIAEREQVTFSKKVADADAVVEENKKAVAAIDQRAMGFAAALAHSEAPKCVQTGGTDRRGHAYKSAKCPPDLKGSIIQANLNSTNAAREVAQTKLNDAQRLRAALDRNAVDQRVSEAKAAYREAVLNSQLHSFTAMVFGKEPTEVSDAEVHRFLRIFVFLPAFFVAGASTLLAMTSVERVKKRPDPVLLPDAAMMHVLGPYTQVILREAADAAHKEAMATIRAAKDELVKPDQPANDPVTPEPEKTAERPIRVVAAE